MVNDLKGTLKRLEKEVISIRSGAREVTENIKRLSSETESLKITILQGYAELLKQTAARDKGMAYLFRDKEKMKAGVLIGTSSFVLAALISRNFSDAMLAGMSGLDGMVKTFGESNWCLILGEKISVVSDDNIPRNASWIPLNSFYTKIKILQEEVKLGETLGSLDDIIDKLL